MVFLSILRQARTPLIKFRGRRGPDASYKALIAKGITPPKAQAVAAPSAAAPKAVQKVAQAAAPKAPPKAAPAAAPKPAAKSAPKPQGKAGAGAKGPTIEDWELPVRYRRLPFDTKEIEYINCGGSPTLGLAKKPPPKKGAKKGAKKPSKPDAKKPKKK